jgi:hypothetical protein
MTMSWEILRLVLVLEVVAVRRFRYVPPTHSSLINSIFELLQNVWLN